MGYKRKEGVNPEAISFAPGQAWLVWGCGALFYLYEMVLRVSPSTMTENLMRDFGVTSTALGILASFYHYSYVLLQIPGGVIVDQWGVRRVITVSAILCTIGSFIFAYADTLLMAQFGRFLIGAGSACAFLSCLKIGSEWFFPAQFAMLAGLTNMMGTLGGTFGGRPFAMLVNAVGWREAMVESALMGVIVSIISWVIIRDHPKGERGQQDLQKGSIKELPLLEGLILVARKPQCWLIALYGSLMYVSVSAFTELWSVPFLMKMYGVSNHVAATCSIALFIGVAVGSPLAVWYSNFRQSRLKAMNIGAIGTLLVFLVILTTPVSFLNMGILLFLAGVFTGGQILCFVSIKEINPNNLSGTSVGFTNAVVMLSGVIFQPLMGMLLDLAWDGTWMPDGVPSYTLENYQVAIMALPVCCFVSWFVMFFAKETYPVKASS